MASKYNLVKDFEILNRGRAPKRGTRNINLFLILLLFSSPDPKAQVQ